MRLNKKKYSSIACAIALATGVTAISGTAVAATGSSNANALNPLASSSSNSGAATLAAAVNANNAVISAAPTEVAPAETAAAEGAAPAPAPQVVTEADKWKAARPNDADIIKLAEQYNGKTIVAVQYDGVTDDVIKTVEVSQASKVGDKFSLALIEKDANNIYNTGYFYDLYPSFQEVPEGVIVTYHVLETPIINSIEIVGNSKVEATEKLEKAMREKPGDRLNRRSVHDDMAAIQKVYVTDGYVMAKIRDLGIDPSGKLTIKVNEGILEGYKIKGLKKTKEKVILRELRTKVGEPLNKKAVMRSYTRLTNLDYFESLDMKPVPGIEPNSCILEIDVTEKNTGTFGIGAGFSSADGLIGMLSLGDKNFRGIGDSINVTFSIGGKSSDSRGWSFYYRKPWLDKKETSMTFRFFDRIYEYDEYNADGDHEEDYMRQRKGFEIGFGRPQSEYTTNFLTLRNRDDEYDEHLNNGGLREERWGNPNNPTDSKYKENKPNWDKWKEDNFGLTRSFIFQHNTDTRDNRFYPTRGYNNTWSLTWAGFGGDFNYVKGTIEHSLYRKVGRNQIFVLRGSYGYSSSDLPDADEFKLGGQDTVRGYRDNQFRGNAMIMASAEFRFPLANKLRGAIFTDAGSAWESGWTPDTLHPSVGVGVLIETPMGPIRLDYGIGTQGNRFHFNMGTTF